MLLRNSIPCEWFATPWNNQDLKTLSARTADPRHQTTLELLTLLLALAIWGPAHRLSGLILLGDNIAALQTALHLKGKPALGTLTRELAWRKARQGLRFRVGHLPSELNTRSDSLSRLTAPEAADFPPELSEATERPAPDWKRPWHTK